MATQTSPQFGSRLPLADSELTTAEQAEPLSDLNIRIRFFLKYITRISRTSPRYSKIIAIFADELLDEMGEQPEEKVNYYLHKLAGMIAWVAEGVEFEVIDLPPDFRWLLDREGKTDEELAAEAESVE
jgi:hypothetical protein